MPYDLLTQIRLDAPARHAATMLAVARDCNCTKLEIAGSETDLLEMKNSQAYSTHVVPRIADNNLSCNALSIEYFVESHLADPDHAKCKAACERIIDIMELATELGADRVSIAPAVVAAGFDNRVNYQDGLNHTAQAMKQIIRRAEHLGVYVCLKASSAGFLTSPPELRELIATINSHAAGVDINTMRSSDQACWQDWFETLEPLVRVLGVIVEPEKRDLSPLEVLNNVGTGIDKICCGTPYEGSLVLRSRFA